MAGAIDISTYAGRLATFAGPVQLTKRRASSAKKAKTPTTVEWPHATPTPEQLAHAGFYYKPSSASNDSVTCFLCKKSLDGWDPEDNPVIEHLNHVPSCGWAININIEQRSQDPNRMEENPLSQKMLDARRATFGESWPHQGKKGWKCQLEKMVAAGWCYVPIPEADDCVQCFFCGVSLDGWEPKDDPWVEHQKRAPECHFFTLIDDAAKAAKGTKGRKGRTSRASRASRLSTQSNLTVVSDVGSIADMDLDDLPAEEGDTVMTTMSTVSKAGGTKGRAKKSTAKTTRKTTRKVKEETVVEPAVEATNDEEAALPLQEEVDQSTISTKPKSGRGRAARKQEDVSEQLLEQSQLSQPARPKRGKKRGTDGLEKLESSVMPEEHVPASKPTRGRKRAAEETSQVEQSLATIQDEEIAPKRGRAAKKAVASQPESSFLMLDLPSPRPTTASPALSSLPKSKAGQAAKASKLQIEETMAEEAEPPKEHSMEPVMEYIREAEPSFHAHPPSAYRAAPATSPMHAPVPEQAEEMDDDISIPPPEALSPVPQPSDVENQPTASSPFVAETTPKAVVRAMTTTKSTPHAAAVAQTPKTVVKASTPVGSTPHAAAKSQTPVATPSRHATTEAKTPTTSPSRKATALQTTSAWNAIDLSRIFLPSPTKGQAQPSAHSSGDNDLKQMVKSLSKEEMEMSVEAWILHNAARAEDKMKDECERLIGKFESSGQIALKSLMGVEVVS